MLRPNLSLVKKHREPLLSGRPSFVTVDCDRQYERLGASTTGGAVSWFVEVLTHHTQEQCAFPR